MTTAILNVLNHRLTIFMAWSVKWKLLSSFSPFPNPESPFTLKSTFTRMSPTRD
jgi:hypothetical protein